MCIRCMRFWLAAASTRATPVNKSALKLDRTTDCPSTGGVTQTHWRGTEAPEYVNIAQSLASGDSRTGARTRRSSQRQRSQPRPSLVLPRGRLIPRIIIRAFPHPSLPQRRLSLLQPVSLNLSHSERQTHVGGGGVGGLFGHFGSNETDS